MWNYHDCMAEQDHAKMLSATKSSVQKNRAVTNIPVSTFIFHVWRMLTLTMNDCILVSRRSFPSDFNSRVVVHEVGAFHAHSAQHLFFASTLPPDHLHFRFKEQSWANWQSVALAALAACFGLTPLVSELVLWSLNENKLTSWQMSWHVLSRQCTFSTSHGSCRTLRAEWETKADQLHSSTSTHGTWSPQ